MIRKADFEEWMNHPVTKELIEQLQESETETKETLSEKLLCEEDEYLYSEKGKATLLGLKAQAQILHLVQDLESFMCYKIEIPKPKEDVINEDEATSPRG